MRSIAQCSDLMQLFADTTRLRLLCLLEREELTVGELTRLTKLSQSRVSTHLGKLRNAGLLRDRRARTSTYYTLDPDALTQETKRLWQQLRTNLDDPTVAADLKRRDAMLLDRTEGSWADSVAGQMERHYSPGRTWESLARSAALMLDLGDVLDVGSGDGAVAELLAPQARSVTCLDASDAVLAAAQKRLSAHSHVAFERGDMEALPFDDARFDQVLLLNVLTFATKPGQALREASRVLRPGGRLVLTTLDEHTHDEHTRAFGHRHLGFAPARLKRLLRTAGLSEIQCAVTHQERRTPHLRVVHAVATR